MNRTFLSVCLLVGIWSCHKSTQTNTALTAVSIPSDSAAIANTVHGFYKWYVAFQQDTTKRIDFTDDSGDHLKLIQPKLERYFAHFKASGFVSDAFIAGELSFYKQCNQAWQREPIDEVPSCMDADKYFCAQDWDAAFWTSSPVRITEIGPDKVRATLYGNYFGSTMERNVELAKENGKWLISHIDCDMGLAMNADGPELKAVSVDERYVQSKLETGKALTSSDFARLELRNIVSEEKRNAPGAKVFILDTLLTSDRGRIMLIGCDTGNETEGWMVQYDNRNKILFWDQVYYADQVEYLKSINSTVSGNEVIIKTTTDADGANSTPTNRYVLTNQLMFERNN